MTINITEDAVTDVVNSSAVGVRGRLWRLHPSDVREIAITASAEILRL
ncbi:HNH endonuclease, partial [Rhodococcus erythropolis]